MASFIDSEIQAAASAVILLGSDAPDLPCDHLQRADDLVTKNDVVLGPCRDGGYYLVGVGAGTWLHDPDIAHLLFDDIPWGTSAVLEITLQRLMQSRRSFACLPPWCDVDEPADLQALCARIDAAQPPDPLAELAESLKRIVGGRLSRG